MKKPVVALAILCAFVLGAAPSAAIAGQRRHARKPRAARPADAAPTQYAIWRPANPGVVTDRHAFDFSSGLEEVFLEGPPIPLSLVRDAGFVESPWLSGPNLIIMLKIEGVEPKLAGDMLYVVDGTALRYRLRPASTVGYWRFEGMYDGAGAERIARIIAGEGEK